MLLRRVLSRRSISCSLQVFENYFPGSSFHTSSTVHVRRLRHNQESSPVKEEEKDSSEKSSDSDSFVQELIEKENPKTLLDNSATYQDDPQGPEDIWTSGPYPHNSNFGQSQAKYSYRPPRIDPKETSILLFPGQGTQYVGMGKDLLKYPNVKEMYSVASEILGYDLLEMSLNGPLKELSRTVHQQPAVVVASLAAVEKLRDERPSALESCVGTAGFSVGEITALTFAGAMSFEDAIRLVKVRAEAMQLASEMNSSGMMTVLYGPDSRLGFACSVAKEFCQAKGLSMVDCRVANYLYPHCKVIAGNDEALEFIEKNKADFKLRRLKRLPVSGAFHTGLMEPAVPALKKILDKIDFDPPLIPVHSNLDGRSYKSTKQIKKCLPKQICKPVKWEQTLHILYEREKGISFPNTFECGPGKSLQTILKMVNAKAYDSCHSIAA
ncbi:malonyl-CoA-acyl carrier protein transacylase beg [Oratosquilla oratoria]|uniref:malonyl-CoA-acyl carrier protein transacylase beg n=1 Tax=Oratosquilla oratoria TaxID=337810 RepID=UPI003F761D9F